jgi:hypothetical protein
VLGERGVFKWRLYLAATVLLPGFFAIATPGRAQTLPSIKKVNVIARGDKFLARIIGTNFGTSPVALPCVKCAIPEMDVFPFDLAEEKVTIRSWTDREIVLSGIKGAAGTSYFFAVKNDSLDATAAGWADLPGGPQPPVIRRVALQKTGSKLHIVVTGSGFGNAPPGVPGNTDIPYFGFITWMAGQQPNSGHYPWFAGYPGNAVTLNYKSWSDSKIEVDGFGSFYGNNNFFVNTGDAAAVVVYSVLPNGGGVGPGAGKATVIP